MPAPQPRGAGGSGGQSRLPRADCTGRHWKFFSLSSLSGLSWSPRTPLPERSLEPVLAPWGSILGASREEMSRTLPQVGGWKTILALQWKPLRGGPFPGGQATTDAAAGVLGSSSWASALSEPLNWHSGQRGSGLYPEDPSPQSKGNPLKQTEWGLGARLSCAARVWLSSPPRPLLHNVS